MTKIWFSTNKINLDDLTFLRLSLPFVAGQSVKIEENHDFKDIHNKNHSSAARLTISHYCDVIMGTMACASNHQPHDCLLNRSSGADQRKHQSSASLAFVRGIHLWLVNSPHKEPVMRKMFPFDDVIMNSLNMLSFICHHSQQFLWIS